MEGPPVAIDQRGRLGDAGAERDPEAGVGMADVGDGMAEGELHPSPVAFVQEHGDDLAGGAVAEELAERLFVPGDAVALDQGEEVGGRVAGERRDGEMGVGGEEAVGGGVEVGEIAAAAARDQDLLSGRVGMVDEQDPAAALAGDGGAHQPRPAGAEDDRVVGLRFHRAPLEAPGGRA